MFMEKILFLCTGNSCRSQMAEAYGKKYLDNYKVYSAGIKKHGLNKYMLKVMQEDGFTMKEHYSKTLDDLRDVNFEVVVTLCDHANESCPIYLKNAKILHRGFEDPAKISGTDEEILESFRRVRDEIKYFITHDLLKILNRE